MKSAFLVVSLAVALVLALSSAPAFAQSTTTVDGNYFVTLPTIDGGSYDIRAAQNLWIGTAPSEEDLLNPLTVLVFNGTCQGPSCSITINITSNVNAGAIILNSPSITLALAVNVNLSSLVWTNGNISGTGTFGQVSLTTVNALIRPISSDYSSPRVFTLRSAVGLTVTGTATLEGVFAVYTEAECNIVIFNIVVRNYKGDPAIRPSVFFRPPPGTPPAYYVTVRDSISIASKTSAQYEPDLWIDCQTFSYRGSNVTLPDFAYFRLYTMSPVEWGGVPTFYMSRGYARFQLSAPAQNVSTMPIITLQASVKDFQTDPSNAVLVWGPPRGSTPIELFFDGTVREGSQIGETWLALYSTLSIAANAPVQRLAGLLLFGGALITPKTGTNLRHLEVQQLLFGGTASSPVTLRATNLTIIATMEDQMRPTISAYLLDSDFPTTQQSRLHLQTASRLTFAGTASVSFKRPLQLRNEACASTCGIVNQGDLKFYQSSASHSIASGFDNIGSVEVLSAQDANAVASPVVSFLVRNILPDSQRTGGQWVLNHVSTSANLPSTVFNLTSTPYGTDPNNAYDFGSNVRFVYPVTSVVGFYNGDFYFRKNSVAPPAISYSVWRNASMDLETDAKVTLTGVIAFNFGARQRNVGAAGPTASVEIRPVGSNVNLLLTDATSPPSQFLVKEVRFDTVNITSGFRMVPPSRSLALTFIGGISYLDGPYFASPSTNNSVTLRVGADAKLWLSDSFSNTYIGLENNGTLLLYSRSFTSGGLFKISVNQPFIQDSQGTLLLTISDPVSNVSALPPTSGQYLSLQHPASRILGRVGVITETPLPVGLYPLLTAPGEASLSAASVELASNLKLAGRARIQDAPNPTGTSKWIILNVTAESIPTPSDVGGTGKTAPVDGNGATGIGGPNGGLVAGVVVAVFVGLAAIALIVFLVRRRKAQKKDKEGGDAEKGTALKNSNYGPVGPAGAAGAAVKSKRKKDSDDSTSEDTPAQYGAIGSGNEPKLERTMSGMDKSKKLLKQKKEGDWQIPFEDLEFDRELGSGAFGSVWKGLWNGAPVAIKQSLLVSATAAQQADFEHEAKLMTALRPHPNVVQTFGLSVAQDRILLVMEYCARGSLTKYFGKKTSLSVEKKLKIVSDLAKGVSHLHKNKIVHRDLAARNVLVTKDWTGKISDFGMSRLIDKSENKATTASNIGPVRWMAPEGIKSKEFSIKTDVWSFGVTVWEIFTELEPHADLDMLDAAIKIRDEKLTPPLNDNIPEPVQEILKRCWQIDPEERPTFDELVKECSALMQNDESESSESDE